MRLWTGFVDYLVLAVLDQPECYYGTPSPREPGNSTEIAQRKTEKEQESRKGKGEGGAGEEMRERRRRGREKERFVTLPFTKNSKLIHD